MKNIKNLNACIQWCVDDVMNKPLDIKDLQNKRDELQKKLALEVLHHLSCGDKRGETLFLLYAYNHEYEKIAPLIKENKYMINLITSKNYSAMGIATITPHNIPFVEQQKFIEKLRILGCKPTQEDKQLALLNRWEKAFNKRILWHYAHKDPSNIIATLPLDILLLISHNMFNVEESLL